jgi:hypothetical protein
MRKSLKTFRHALFILIVIITSCKKDNDAGVHVKFINSTGKELAHVKVNDRLIGAIKKADHTGYIRFDEFGVDTGMPDASFVALVDGAEIGCTSKFYWCGTEKGKLPNGKYEIYVSIINDGNSSYFHLTFR